MFKDYLREMGVPTLIGCVALVVGRELFDFNRLAALGLGAVTMFAVWWFFTREE